LPYFLYNRSNFISNKQPLVFPDNLLGKTS
jgi:hypothetical protein